jgi:hypothetical protein
MCFMAGIEADQLITMPRIYGNEGGLDMPRG